MHIPTYAHTHTRTRTHTRTHARTHTPRHTLTHSFTHSHSFTRSVFLLTPLFSWSVQSHGLKLSSVTFSSSFWVPFHTRFNLESKQSLQSTAVSPNGQSSPEQSLMARGRRWPMLHCGHPLEWAMSGISEHGRWCRTEGFCWGTENLCHIGSVLGGRFMSVEIGEEMTVSHINYYSKDCDLSCTLLLVDAVLLCSRV